MWSLYRLLGLSSSSPSDVNSLISSSPSDEGAHDDTFSQLYPLLLKSALDSIQLLHEISDDNLCKWIRATNESNFINSKVVEKSTRIEKLRLIKKESAKYVAFCNGDELDISKSPEASEEKIIDCANRIALFLPYVQRGLMHSLDISGFPDKSQQSSWSDVINGFNTLRQKKDATENIQAEYRDQESKQGLQQPSPGPSRQSACPDRENAVSSSPMSSFFANPSAEQAHNEREDFVRNSL